MPQDLHPARRRCLLDHPQPLGIWPTRWFWRDRDNGRLAAALLAPFTALLTIVVGLLHPPIVAGAVIAAVTSGLALGGLERYIRREATKRRQKALGSSEVASTSPAPARRLAAAPRAEASPLRRA